MQLDNLIEGLQIVRKYTDDPWSIGAEHDEIFAHVDREMDSADSVRMVELGWHQCDEYGSDTWIAFT